MKWFESAFLVIQICVVLSCSYTKGMAADHQICKFDIFSE